MKYAVRCKIYLYSSFHCIVLENHCHHILSPHDTKESFLSAVLSLPLTHSALRDNRRLPSLSADTIRDTCVRRRPDRSAVR